MHETKQNDNHESQGLDKIFSICHVLCQGKAFQLRNILRDKDVMGKFQSKKKNK